MDIRPFIFLVLLWGFIPIQNLLADNTKSETYRIELTQSKCHADNCSGNINIYDKKSGGLFQTIPFKTSDLTIDDIKEGPAPVIFGDFNFDGSEDFAIPTEQDGQANAYTIYLFDETAKKIRAQ